MALRARIMLRVHEHSEHHNQQIATALGVTDRSVRVWRARWVETHSLADAPRSGALVLCHL
jgi:FixJ family two-component response regulator